MLNKTQPRDLLRAAIAARDERRRRVDAASATLACADDLRSEALCQADLLEVEEAIVSHRADAVRAWAARSDGAKPSMAVPESLIARRRACAEASESAAAAASARKALSDELVAAKAALAEAERSAKMAALPIVLEEAGRVAARLDAAKQEVWQFAARLRGLAELWLPTGADQTPRPVRSRPSTSVTSPPRVASPAPRAAWRLQWAGTAR